MVLRIFGRICCIDLWTERRSALVPLLPIQLLVMMFLLPLLLVMQMPCAMRAHCLPSLMDELEEVGTRHRLQAHACRGGGAVGAFSAVGS